MKVFHIICKLDLGGSERVAINIAKHKENDVEQHIVELMRGNSAFTEGIISELEENGITYHRSCLPVLFEWHYVPSVSWSTTRRTFSFVLYSSQAEYVPVA